LKLFITASVVLFILTISLSFLMSLDWNALTPAFLRLGLVLGLLYWTTTLLPGPVKRVGKAAGRKAWRAIRNQRDNHGH
jgi:hypothetical protein